VIWRAEGETWREAATFHRYAALRWVSRRLPTRTGRALAKLAGTAAYRLAPRARAVVAANQAQVLGRSPDDPLVQGSTREAFQLYARFWFDTFHIGTWDDEQVLAAVRFERLELLHEAIAAGDGVVIALTHSGAYDVAGRAVVAAGIPVVAVAEELEPPRLYELFREERAQGLGVDVIGLADPHVGRRLISALRGNQAVALLADRDLNGRGAVVEMFGRPIRLPVGPAMLAMQAGAPILIAETMNTPQGWTVRFVPFGPLPDTGDRRADVTASIERIASLFEHTISAAPADWHMFQPAWEA
jgi:KDO2-lipid IV(A) lauroyltransferase